MSRDATRRPTRRLGLFLAFGGVPFLLFALAAPAAAVIEEGTCNGSATFVGAQFSIAADQPLDPVIEVPTDDSVDWSGTVGIAAPAEEVPFSGSVVLETALGSITIADWEGETTEVARSGRYSYDVPGWLPKGTGPIPVVATHDHGGAMCKAKLLVTFEGSAVNVWSIGSLALTGLSALGLGLAGRKP